MDKPIIAISDIHGCASELKLLLNKLPLTSDTSLIFLGDYIDRGHQSKDVIDTIIQLKKSYNVVTLKGNHEQMFLDFLDDPASEGGASFVVNGGSATLSSYADNEGHYHIPDDHIEFFESLGLYHQTDDHFYVHAGVPDVKIEDIDETKHDMDMLWIRGSFHQSSFDWEKVIVHGHTPVSEVEETAKRVNIDTGLVYRGYLTALQLPEKKTYSVARESVTRHTYLRHEGKTRQAVRFTGSVPIYIYKTEEILQFATIDYSELGIYVQDIVNDSKQVLDLGQKVQGAIGRDDYNTVAFEGTVLRCDKNLDGFFYALQLNKTPYEFIGEQEAIGLNKQKN